MKVFNWPLVALAYLSLFCLGIADNGRSAIYPDLLNKLSLGFDQGSLLFSISSLTGLISTLSAKFWLPRFGLILPQRFFAILLFVACIIFGLSISIVPSFLLAILACSLIGITMGGLSITMNLSIDQAVPETYRRKFLSGLHSLYGLSSGFAPVLLLFLSTWEKSYEELYYVISIFPIILFLLSYKVKIKDKLLENDPMTSIENSFVDDRVQNSLKLNKIIIVGSILSFYVCSEVLLSSRFVLISQSLTKISNEASQSYLSLFFILLTFGRFIFAFIKTQTSNFAILTFSIASSVMLFISAIVLKKLIYLSLIGLSMSVYFPCAMDLIANFFGRSFNLKLPTIMNLVTVKLIIMHQLAGKMEMFLGASSTLYLSVAFIIFAFISLMHTKTKTNSKL